MHGTVGSLRRLLGSVSLRCLLLTAAALPLGCDLRGGAPAGGPRGTTAAAPQNAWSTQPTVHAQGTLRPAGGVLRMVGAPGDKIEQVLVQPDQAVSAGDQLIRLASERARREELRLLDERIADAEQALELQVAEADEVVLRAQRAVQQAEMAQRHAEEQFELVRQAQRSVETARRPLQRLEQAAQESPGRGLVSPADIDRQRLAVEQAEQQWRQSSLAAQQAQEAAALALEAAQRQLAAAQQSRQRLEQSRALAVLRQQRVVVETQLELAQVVAPIDGVVLRVDAHAGDSVGQTPLVELADLSQVQCFAEVHEADAPRVRLGQMVQMESAALERPLTGRVTRIDSVVGRPQLRSPNPLAPVDFRSVGVTISLDEESAALAARWIQLQVDVTIQTPRQDTGGGEATDRRDLGSEVNGRGDDRGTLTGQP